MMKGETKTTLAGETVIGRCWVLTSPRGNVRAVERTKRKVIHAWLIECWPSKGSPQPEDWRYNERLLLLKGWKIHRGTAVVKFAP